ncbi:MAG TPA: hypothetical protein VMN39_07960 [Longimicrobiaceae bacterium]|nr:hypothetical protein [Longimicrobiaceae bacterium]
MKSQPYALQERTLRLAHEFLREVRSDLERATAEGTDLPPRIRTVHDRPGHASPEYRTLAVPLPEGAAGGSPEVLSTAIAGYARRSLPQCILLALDVLGGGDGGESQPLLIAEARDRNGTRLYMIQPFDIIDGSIVWKEPIEGGWQEPGEQEMILDSAFSR